MNMKKTIAAVAACAVAVSAMATTVSAEEGVLHYNLVKTVYKTEGTATYQANISNLVTGAVYDAQGNLVTPAATEVVIKAIGFHDTVNFSETVFTITGYNLAENGAKTDPFNFVVTNKDATWSLNRSDWVDIWAWDNTLNKSVPTITIPVAETASQGIVAGNTYISITAPVKHTNSGWTDNLNQPTAYFTANGKKMATTLTAYSSSDDAVAAEKPFETKLNGVSATPDVIAYLEGTDDPNVCNNLVEKGKDYVNVKAVLNDVIANYDDVTFTFNTATKKVSDGTENQNPGYGAYFDNGNIDCRQFGQHLYNLYGDENTKYVYSTSYDWSYYNLFSGALIVNDGLSMSLNDASTFDYGASSISFNWADVTDGQGQVNNYVNYLQSMRLATSTTWFWDSMDVKYSNTEAEDVSSDAAAETEDDEIAEDDADAEVVDDVDDEPADVADEEPADEPAEEPAEDTTPVAEATNPGTGNAPIALAVIPVALAAAAVVAKKRG